MTWLVIGSNGQLGKALSFVLDERGIEYHASNSKEIDIRSSLACGTFIGLLAPSVIVNAAAWTDVDGAESNPDEAYAVNAYGAHNLALAAKSVGAIFAHVSTDYVFSGVSDRPWQEDDVRHPISVYGASKAAGEGSVLSEYSDRSYIFRTAWLYSRWGKNFAKTMARFALVGNDEVRVVSDQIGQPTSALDFANQIVDSVLANLPFAIYHGTNSGHGSWFDLAKEIFELTGASTSRVLSVLGSEFARPATRPAYSVLGHDAWSAIGSTGCTLTPMRSWRMALREEMPPIIEAVKSELPAG